MPLKKCKECEKEVSSFASKCPGCGVSNPTSGAKEIFAGLGFVLFLGWLFYINVIDKTVSEQATPIVAVAQTPKADVSPKPTAAPSQSKLDDKAKLSTQDRIGTADNFCNESSELYGKIDTSFKHLQSGISESKKNKSQDVLVTTIQAFMLRSSELQDDADSLSPPSVDLDAANSAMADMTLSVQGIAKSNASAAENLRALFSSEQSMERTQENAKRVGETRDYFTMKYSLSSFKLFESLGFKVEDLDEKTMCLKASSLNKIAGKSA